MVGTRSKRTGLWYIPLTLQQCSNTFEGVSKKSILSTTYEGARKDQNLDMSDDTTVVTSNKTRDKYNMESINKRKLSGERCYNIHRLNKITEVLEYIYASLFSPKKSTLLEAIKNNNLSTFPGLTYKNAQRYINETIATAKGHLDRTRKNERSTKKVILD